MKRNRAAVRSRLTQSRTLMLGLVLGLPSYAIAEPVAQQPARAADTLFINGTVLVPGGTAQAVAVQDGSITAVGTSAEILATPHNGAAIVDLGGKTLMPGLYDSHVHLYMAGLEMSACHVAPDGGARALVASVAACRAKAAPGEWIVGSGWIAASFKQGEQTARLLDAASPDNPVLLYDQSRHSAWLNSAALKLANITRSTPDPAGGTIERGRDGQPTGILREQAQGLAEAALPKKSPAEQLRAIKASTDLMLSYGIVGMIDAMVTDEWADSLSAYARSGQLKQHVRGCIAWRWNAMRGEELFAHRQQLSGGRLSLDCIKLFLDGVPLESQTAAMIEPYHPIHGADGIAGQSGNHGTLLYRSDELEALVKSFDRQGMQVKFHAAGDASVRQAVDAVAATRKANGWSGQRHNIAHATFITPGDLSRATALDFAWEFSPYFWWPAPNIVQDMAASVGQERMGQLWPVREALDSGALSVVGSDWPVVPAVNPWLAFETLVSRQVPGATGQVLNPNERIGREEALAMLTRNGAALMNRLDRGGTIEVGKAADMIVVDRNPLAAPLGTIHDTKVLKTYIDGKLVYSAP